MNIKLYKHRYNKGGYCNKMPQGTNATQTKQIAMREITEAENRCYIPIEYKILNYCQNANKYIQINTNLL